MWYLYRWYLARVGELHVFDETDRPACIASSIKSDADRTRVTTWRKCEDKQPDRDVEWRCGYVRSQSWDNRCQDQDGALVPSWWIFLYDRVRIPSRYEHWYNFFWYSLRSRSFDNADCECQRIHLQNVCPVLCFAAIPPAFWDQLIHSEADSSNLFSVTTPHVDRRLQPSTPSFHSYALDTSQGMYLIIGLCGGSANNLTVFSPNQCRSLPVVFQTGWLQLITKFLYFSDISGSDSTGSSSYSDTQGDRYKRRRMLQFTGVNTGGFAQDSPPPYESVIGSPTTTYSSSYSSYTSSYGVRHPPSSHISTLRFWIIFLYIHTILFYFGSL